MLLGSIYNIIESGKEGTTYHLKVSFNPAHKIFEGHFPDLPVVPGVCQTQMLVETLSHLLSRNLEIKHAHHIKFLALLNPVKDNQLNLAIKIEKEEGDILWVSALYSSEAETFFRFKGELH